MPAILVVCTANRIRSVMVEHLLKANLAGRPDASAWIVESAGTWTETGLPAMPKAMNALAQRGLDASQHLSRAVDDVDMARYDLIITMERSQRDALRAEFPQASSRIFTLSEAAIGLAYDVDDPVGRPSEQYTETLRELDGLLLRGQEMLLEKATTLAAQRRA